MRSSHSFLHMLNSTRETANVAMLASAAGGRPPGPPCTTTPPPQCGALRYRRYKELKESSGQSLLAGVMSAEATAEGDRGNTNTTNLYPQLSRHELAEATAEGDKRGLHAIRRDVMSVEPAAGDKRSALDAPHTHDDDGCAAQGEGAGAAGGASACTSALRPAAASRGDTSSV
jgi:hypothetical protein